MTLPSSFAHADREIFMPHELKIGMLGGGLDSVVGGAHLGAIGLSGRFKVEAGCFSRKNELNVKTALKYNVASERTYASLADMLAAEKTLDAIVILTPTDQHGEQVLACLNAGMPVICEKALAHSSAHLESIRDKLNESKGFLAVISNYTGYPMLRELAQIVRSDALGKIKQIRLEMPQEGFLKLNKMKEPITPQDWRLKDGEVPTISLDLGVHLHMIIKFVTDQTPIALTAHYGNFGNFPVIDDVECMLAYTSDMKAHVWYGKTALGQQNGLRVKVFGTEGSVEWYQMEPETLHCADRQGRRSTMYRGHPDALIANEDRYGWFKPGHPEGFGHALANYYVDIANALNTHQKGQAVQNNFVAGIEDAVGAHRVFCAMNRSVTQRQWVGIEEDPVFVPGAGHPMPACKLNTSELT